jgi:2,3-bisphosphoglycerate-dependent phosphoglycerate mutase
MTTIYFVRHAEPNYDNHNDAERELTAKGLRDRERVTKYLSDKGIDAVLSSPYRRAVDTVKQFADIAGLPVEPVPGFRERRIDSGWIADFDEFSRQQWADFSYKRSDGESLGEVQRRNLAALEAVLENHPDQTLAVGGHGTALSTLIHAFDPTFGYKEFTEIKGLMPWIVKFTFQGKTLEKMEFIDVFAL